MYDFVNYQEGGVNWVKHLPVYARVMNEDPKEVLSYTFQVYYGRKSHRLSNPVPQLKFMKKIVHQETAHPKA